DPQDAIYMLPPIRYPDGRFYLKIGGDPHDVRISFDDENIPTIAWVRDRLNPEVLGFPDDSKDRPEGDPDDVVFKARMVEGNRNLEGAVTALSPAKYGRENDVDDLAMFTPFDGKPILAWNHDLGGGLFRIETGHYVKPGGFQGWTGSSPGGSDVSRPSISGNGKAAIVGWNHSDTSFASWTRFSNESFEPNVLSGYGQVSDPSFIMVDEGYTLAAYTATVQGVSSVRISRYSNPGAGLSPDQFTFGKVNVGTTREVAYLLRSNGQTPVEFNGFDITGLDASDFTLDVPAGCDGTHAIRTSCQFRLRFTPSSAGPKSATLTAHTSAGDLQSVVSGSGGTGGRLSLTSTPAKKRVKAGTTVRIKVTAKNLTVNEAGDARICPTLNRKVLRLGKKCVSIGNLAGNAERQVVFPVRVTAKARRGQEYPVKFRLRAANAVERLSITRLTRK
ncbi:MAG: choice-of-anchor D domain-containing protein, partial [Solirubrobacterales bacterium]|nr:choice-of-anchor D domain-containing protein [Solirubrobacterales bacterium]